MRCYFLFLFFGLIGSVSVYGQDTDAIQSELDSIKIRDSGSIPIRYGVNFQNPNSIFAVDHKSFEVSNILDPLFIILADGKSLEVLNNPNTKDSVSLNQFNPEWIESITVLKGKDSTDKYGERGQNGAVLITLKKDILNTMPIEISRKFK